MSNVRRIQERHKAKSRAALGTEKWRDDYWTLSKLPLHALVFLIPLIVLYELGSIAYLRGGGGGGGGGGEAAGGTGSVSTQIRAESILHVFFEVFGVFGVLAPGLLLVAVLLTWHFIRKDRFVVRPMVVVGMYLESAMWVLPLIVLAAVVTDAAARMAPALQLSANLAANGNGPPPDLLSYAWQARATIAVGAGVYEELLFRLIGIALLDVFLQGIIESPKTRAVLCVILTALAFAAYHDAAFTVDPAHGQGFLSVVRSLLNDGPAAALARVKWGNALFFFVAGVYFAGIYLSRGFGVVVGTHAAYDLAVLVLLSSRA